MKIITNPTVYLIGRQTVGANALDRFLGDHDAAGWESDSEVGAEVLSEVGGRLCYMSFAKPRPGGNAAYLAHIREAGHTSVYEHAVWTLLITGVSRSLLAEFTRHRVGMSPSVLSQRYVDESVAEYVVPDIIWIDPELRDIWVEAARHAHESYRLLADKLTARLSDRHSYAASLLPADATPTDRRKAARQAARSVLPNATETKIAVTANARALRHFLEQRGSRHAEPEIRKLANAMLDLLAAEAPHLFGDYDRTLLPDGTHEITTQTPKV